MDFNDRDIQRLETTIDDLSKRIRELEVRGALSAADMISLRDNVVMPLVESVGRLSDTLTNGLTEIKRQLAYWSGGIAVAVAVLVPILIKIFGK